jgi:hypothetical protein
MDRREVAKPSEPPGTSLANWLSERKKVGKALRRADRIIAKTY